jgi:hypothetical protein
VAVAITESEGATSDTGAEAELTGHGSSEEEFDLIGFAASLAGSHDILRRYFDFAAAGSVGDERQRGNRKGRRQINTEAPNLQPHFPLPHLRSAIPRIELTSAPPSKTRIPVAEAQTNLASQRPRHTSQPVSD